jgi:hypothetical protein
LGSCPDEMPRLSESCLQTISRHGNSLKTALGHERKSETIRNDVRFTP